MALDVFSVVGTYAINGIEQANSDIDSVTSNAESSSISLGDVISSTAKWGVAIAAGVAAAAAGVVSFAKSSADACDTVDKMSQKIGISREAYQELDFICSQSGTSVDNLRGGMKTLTNVLAEAQTAASDSDAAVAALDEQFGNGAITLDEYNQKYDEIYDSAYSACGGLQQLGFSLDDISKMSTEDALYATIEALQGMPDDANRAALAQDLLGKSAQELAPLLNSGVGSMEEMKQKAHDLGLVIDDETVNSGVQLTDTLDQLERSFQAIFVNLGGAVMPIIQQLAQMIINNIPTIQAVFEQLSPIIQGLFEGMIPKLAEIGQALFPTIIDLVNVIIGLFASLLPQIMQLVGSLLPPIVDLINVIIPLLLEIIEQIMPIAVELLNALLPALVQVVSALLPPLVEVIVALLPLLQVVIDLIMPILDLITEIAPELASLISNNLVPLIETIVSFVQHIEDYLLPAIYMIKDIVQPILSFLFDQFAKGFDECKKVLDKFMSFFSNIFAGNFDAAFQDIKDIVDLYINGFITAIKDCINFIIGAVNTMTQGLNGIKIPDWIPGIGGTALNIPEIPMLAKGGVVDGATASIVGEAGAEAVIPLEHNTKGIDMIASAISSRIGTGNNKDIIDKLDELIAAFKALNIYLDTGALVGGIAPGMNQEFGKLAIASGRGR